MKKTLRPRSRAFTLIELLTVIAVIGILASILIPTVGAARKAANKAKTKAQFAGWANAIQNFKSTYGYYPDFLDEAGAFNLEGNSREFVETLSGRTMANANGTGGGDVTREGGNRRAAPFYSFAEGEFDIDDATQLVDAFGNPDINILVDEDGDGTISVTNLADNSVNDNPRVKVIIWSVENDNEGYPGIYSWD